MKLEPKKTAVLTLDIQTGVIAMIPECETALSQAAKVVEHARRNGLELLHVGLGFEPGYPGINFDLPRTTRCFSSGLENPKVDNENV